MSSQADMAAGLLELLSGASTFQALTALNSAIAMTIADEVRRSADPERGLLLRDAEIQALPAVIDAALTGKGQS